MKMGLLVLMIIICLATSLPIDEENWFSRTSVYVREVEVDQPRHRTIRQTGMLRQMKFSFTFKGRTVELDLELNGLIRDGVNMYVTKKNTTTLVERNTKNEVQYGYYQDKKTKASVMVKCNKVKCTPVGTFSTNGRRYWLDSNDNLAEPTQFVTEVPLRPENVNIKGDTKTKFEHINPKDGSVLIKGTSAAGSSTSRKRDKNKDNSGSRMRRGITAGVDIVELFVYTDEAIINRFRNLYTELNTALEMTRQYYSLICNEMDLEYQQVKDKNSAGIDIRIYFKGIHVALDSTGAPWSSNTQDSMGIVDSSKALEQFSFWQKDFKYAKSFSYDYAMAMFGKTFNNSIIGRSWVGTVCHADDVYHTSIIEDTGLGLSLVAVHEMGHFLSAVHDPTGGDCSLGYIMGSRLFTADETTARIQHTFSSCSINDFTNKLNSLGNWHENLTATEAMNETKTLHLYVDHTVTLQDAITIVNRCTRQHSFTDQEYTASRSEPIGGEQLSLDQQCQVYFGAGSYACSKGIDMCYRGISCQTLTGCSGHLYMVLDHSPCQEPSNKWCFRGLCVDKPAMLTTTKSQSTTPNRPSTTTGSPPSTIAIPQTTKKSTINGCTVIVTCTRVGRILIGNGCCTNSDKPNCCTKQMTNPTCSVTRSC